MKRPTYMIIADEISADISAGILTEGEQLPSYRQFSYARGIASSTASRVYEELVRRGLVLGEIGRGTFVRTAEARSRTTLIEPVSVQVDLEHNYSIRSHHTEKISQTLSDLGESIEFGDSLTPLGAAGWKNSQKVAARYLKTKKWKPKPNRILFSGNGRQAIISVLSAITKPGDRIGVEAVTYPVFIGIAQKLGLVLIPIAMDSEGIEPKSLLHSYEKHGLQALYIQPTLHSPTAITMSANRRSAIANIIRKLNLPTLEDAVYSFLAEEPPLCSFAPEQVIYIDSLSKSIAPGLALGMIYSPDDYHQKIKTSLQYGAWTAPGLLLALGTKWMKSVDFKKIIIEKQADAIFRQKIARKIFSNINISGDTRAYHLWLPLPDNVKCETFSNLILKMGIAVTAGSEFSSINGISPNYIRLSLASPDQHTLITSLKMINEKLIILSK